MSYDVYWVKNRAEKIADFEHPTLQGDRLPPQTTQGVALGYELLPFTFPLRAGDRWFRACGG